MRITGGFLKNRSILSPKGLSTRPTSEKLRQTVFNICQNQVKEAHFLDLFAGSGAMGIEALSRGAASATFIENNRSALKAIRDNLDSLDLTPLATILAGDVLLMVKKLEGRSFDLIYVDPPYERALHEKTLLLIDSLSLLTEEGTLFIEELSLEELPLKNLNLRKRRKAGSTFLYEFCFTP